MQRPKSLILKKCLLALEADLREAAWKSLGLATQEDVGMAESCVRVMQRAKGWSSGLCEKLPGGGSDMESALVRQEGTMS